MSESQVPVSRIVAALPRSTPFMPPEALERERGGAFRLRLGANESAFGPSPRALEAIDRAQRRIFHYCDGTCFALRRALAQHLGCHDDHVLVGPGIDGMLGHFARRFLDPGDLAVTSEGSYPTLEYAVMGVGGVLHRVPYRDDAPDLEALSDAVRTCAARLVYLANPDNPSGAWHAPEALARWIDTLPDDVAILLDEAYAEFAPASPTPDTWLEDPRVVRLRTFSKVYGMAGMRVSYAFGHPDALEPVHRFRMHFEVNLLAQEAATASLDDREHVRWVVQQTEEGRRRLGAMAERMGLRALPSATNFVCLDLGSHERAVSTLRTLAELGAFIRMPWAPPLNRCIRVTVGPTPELELFGEILQEALARVDGVSR